MENSIHLALEKAGLSKGEIKVYLALVKLGKVTTGPIIKLSKVSSSKVYDILDKLIEKGLVNYILVEKTRYFQASQPMSLLDYVNKKEKEIQNTKGEIEKVIKMLEKTESQDVEEAKIYKGYRGMRTGFFEAIKSIQNKGEYLFFSVGYGEDPYLQQFFRDLSTKLKERGIKVRGIANNEEEKLYKKYYEKLGYLMKYTKMHWPSDITIAGDNLITFVWDKKQPVIYVIQSRPLVESYKKFFEELWEIAKP